jgi:hypothetical protein
MYELSSWFNYYRIRTWYIPSKNVVKKITIEGVRNYLILRVR